MEETYNPGDEIYNKSEPTIKWVVEEVFEKHVICSRYVKATSTQEQQKFSLVSIAKCSTGPSISFGSSRRNSKNHY